MQLSKYISDLLYRYECVMVPNFGGFISNTNSSQLNSVNHLFTPPKKNISFNINLQQNDGLLVNHISKSLNITFDEATTMVLNTVENWKADLENAPLLLQNIGQFTYIDLQLNFEPMDKINYLSSSFGLSDVDANYVLRHNAVISEDCVSDENEAEQNNTEITITSKKSYGKYIAAAAIFAGLFIGANLYINNLATQQELASQQKINSKIQQASFNILNPLPAITLTISKNTPEKDIELTETVFYKYHIIAGAFKDAENADKKVNFLIKKGYNANVIGLNKWGLTQVSYASFNNKKEAINTLNSIRKKDNKHAWLYVDK